MTRRAGLSGFILDSYFSILSILLILSEKDRFARAAQALAPRVAQSFF
jgi:hypothetical protein